LGKTKVARGVTMNYKKHHIRRRKSNASRLDKWKHSAKFHLYYGGEADCKVKLKKLVNKI